MITRACRGSREVNQKFNLEGPGADFLASRQFGQRGAAKLVLVSFETDHSTVSMPP